MSSGIDRTDVPALSLTDREKEDIMRMAALGVGPYEMAMSMGWPEAMSAAFVSMAAIPGSAVSRLIASGRTSGRMVPQTKLHEAASSGNLEAIKALRTVQTDNRFNELVRNMDDDELGP